jgi:2-isopropylmalate synthase
LYIGTSPQICLSGVSVEPTVHPIFMTTTPSNQLWIYDTTLRDGTQREGLSVSIEDKLRIAHKLDELGIPFIEGGWPGANPKDVQFFEQLQANPLKQA